MSKCFKPVFYNDLELPCWQCESCRSRRLKLWIQRAISRVKS